MTRTRLKITMTPYVMDITSDAAPGSPEFSAAVKRHFRRILVNGGSTVIDFHYTVQSHDED